MVVPWGISAAETPPCLRSPKHAQRPLPVPLPSSNTTPDNNINEQEKYEKPFEQLDSDEKMSVGGTIGGRRGGNVRKKQMGGDDPEKVCGGVSLDGGGGYVIWELGLCVAGLWGWEWGWGLGGACSQWQGFE